MKKYLLSLTTLALLLCEVSFTGGGMAFAASSGSCGTNVTYTLSDAGVLTITGTGAMTTYSNGSSTPWYSSRGSVTKIEIKDGVTSIGNHAFYGCNNATTVQISPTVTSIGQNAFQSCSKIATINYQKNSLGSSSSDRTTAGMWSQISFANEASNPLNANSSGGELYCVQQSGPSSNSLSKITQLGNSGGGTISGKVTINAYAFVRNKAITSVSFPHSVTSVGTAAFKNCTGLTTVQFGIGTAESSQSAMERIENYAFNGCTKVTTIRVYGGLAKWLGIELVSNDSNPFFSSTNALAPSRKLYIDGTTDACHVTSVALSSNIQANQFYNNNTLSSVAIEEGVTTIGNYAFKLCSALTYISLPSTITTIGTGVFNSCSSLSSYSYANDIAHWVNINFGGADGNPMCQVNKCYIGSAEQTAIVIPSGVETIKQ